MFAWPTNAGRQRVRRAVISYALLGMVQFGAIFSPTQRRQGYRASSRDSPDLTLSESPLDDIVEAILTFRLLTIKTHFRHTWNFLHQAYIISFQGHC